MSDVRESTDPGGPHALTRSPWRVEPPGQFVYWGWSILDAKGVPVVRNLTEDLARHLAELHNAALVQLRRGWWAVPVGPGGKTGWQLRTEDDETEEDFYLAGNENFPTPAAALLAAEEFVTKDEK